MLKLLFRSAYYDSLEARQAIPRVLLTSPILSALAGSIRTTWTLLNALLNTIFEIRSYGVMRNCRITFLEPLKEHTELLWLKNLVGIKVSPLKNPSKPKLEALIMRCPSWSNTLISYWDDDDTRAPLILICNGTT